MVMTTIAVADHISPLSATPSVKKESKIQSVTCQTERAKLIIHSYLNQLCKKGRLVIIFLVCAPNLHMYLPPNHFFFPYNNTDFVSVYK